MKEMDLGTGNIGSLVKRFSIPCVISMVVAALYNIVDQIYDYICTGIYNHSCYIKEHCDNALGGSYIRRDSGNHWICVCTD